MVGMLAAAGALAVAVPAAAHPSPPSHPNGGGSQRCKRVHKVAYTFAGPVLAWNLTDTNGVLSGSFQVHVTRANHHAGALKGTDVTFSDTAGTGVVQVDLANAKLRLGQGVTNPPVAGDWVKVIGNVTRVNRNCTDQSAAGQITFKRIIVHLPPQ
jgi:hypothetical protein